MFQYVRSKDRHDPAVRVWPRIPGLVVTASALVAFLGLPVLRPLPSGPESQAPFKGRTIDVNASIQSVSAPARLNYNYSVIPGGARDAQELARAIQTDEVVADHYRHVNPLTMRPQTLAVERMAHVSYRINDRVFWTKKPVRIYEGETILTNGETEIRARCGNGISLAPLLPTSDEEPESTQFDALMDNRPMLIAFGWPFTGVPSVPAPQPPGEEPPMAFVYPPFGVGGFASGPYLGQPNGTFPEDPSGPVSSEFGFDSSTFDPGFDPFASDPGEFDPSEFDPSEFDPSEFDPSDPLVLQPLIGEPDPTTRFPGTHMTPVPEPATLILLGSGIAGLFARHRRKKSR